ncbi:hypothetical protein EST38_g11165 [Candolleomyces aberdarensis]|uniref:Uncharacterized protein n=1 Tax=Candolleomyces aberdarensis TaxID=2316362 RepID=A0A4Q2D5J8_9AGAR|nr:hypothetical protein EST38_g11165 [Candolleomyces aberdarensis]
MPLKDKEDLEAVRYPLSHSPAPGPVLEQPSTLIERRALAAELSHLVSLAAPPSCDRWMFKLLDGWLGFDDEVLEASLSTLMQMATVVQKKRCYPYFHTSTILKFMTPDTTVGSLNRADLQRIWVDSSV